jgi:hypothetical protein
MLNRLVDGQSLEIVGRVGIAVISWGQLTRLVRDWLKSSSLVLQHDCRNPHRQSTCSHGERRIRTDLHEDYAWRGDEP